jgi:hypothetical protein
LLTVAEFSNTFAEFSKCVAEFNNLLKVTQDAAAADCITVLPVCTSFLYLNEDVAELSCEHSSWHLRQIHIDEMLALSSTACSGLLSVVFAHGTQTHCMDPNGGKESINDDDNDDDDNN